MIAKLHFQTNFSLSSTSFLLQRQFANARPLLTLPSETIVYLKIEGFHCAALASITDEQPVSTRYFSMSSYPFTNVETPLAITGIETAWATSRITSIWTGSLGLSCFSLLKIRTGNERPIKNRWLSRVSQGFWGSKGAMAKYRREEENISLFSDNLVPRVFNPREQRPWERHWLLGNRGAKLYKLEDENMVSKFIKRGTNKENVWKHGAILEGKKDPYGRPLLLRFYQVITKSYVVPGIWTLEVRKAWEEHMSCWKKNIISHQEFGISVLSLSFFFVGILCDSVLYLPWTPNATMPVLSTSLAKATVSSIC